MSERAPNLSVTIPELHRMSLLREEGLPYTAIATVLRLDTGRPWTAERVRGCLNRYVPGSRKSPRGRPLNGPLADEGRLAA